jgi:hypothetical protein
MLLEWALMHTVVCGAVALAGAFVALTADKDASRRG